MAAIVIADGPARAADLLQMLCRGEHIALDTARRQARLAPDKKMQRFFHLQTTQETMHAGTLQTALAVLGARNRVVSPLASAALDDYSRNLEADLARSDLAATLVGLQIVFESLGEYTLSRASLAPSGRATLFAPFKRVLLHQEDTHHAFGCRWLARQPPDELPRLRNDARRYFALACNIVDGAAELICRGPDTPATYKNGMRALLPPVLFDNRT